MKVELQRVLPADIEKRSMEIIGQELAERGVVLDPENEPVIRRCIHTSADFDYADNLVFSPSAVEFGIAALKAGATIVTDTLMAWSGISKPAMEKLGCTAECFMSDPDVAATAKRNGTTRAVACMEKGAALGGNLIFAIGNAPTALVRLYEMIEEGTLRPSLIVGVPVGFVNVVESKELILTTDVPYIVARGRKGGSNIAACIMNALLYQATGRPSDNPAVVSRLRRLEFPAERASSSTSSTRALHSPIWTPASMTWSQRRTASSAASIVSCPMTEKGSAVMTSAASSRASL